MFLIEGTENMSKVLKLSPVLLALLGTTSGYAGTATDNVKFDPTRMYYGIEAVYGMLTPYNDVNTAYAYNYSNHSDYYPELTNNWGVRLKAGYHLNAEKTQDLEASYLYLKNRENSQASGTLNPALNIIEDYTQFNGTASVQNYNRYQTLQLNKIKRKSIDLLPSVSQGLFYGIRGSYLNTNLNAQYFEKDVYSSQVSFSNKLYGIGPQIGEAVKWSATSMLEIGGNIATGLLFGGSEAKYSETTSTNMGPYAQTQGTTTWAALLLAGEVYAGLNFKEGLRLDGGVSGDQYISGNSSNKFSIPHSGSLSNSNNYTFRNVFIRLSYKA